MQCQPCVTSVFRTRPGNSSPCGCGAAEEQQAAYRLAEDRGSSHANELRYSRPYVNFLTSNSTVLDLVRAAVLCCSTGKAGLACYFLVITYQ